jgi:glycosyltransferase involved in cell wall biosynthesis
MDELIFYKSSLFHLMKILFLTPHLPFPPVGGSAIKTFKVIDHLLGLHTVTLACILKGLEDVNNLDGFKLEFRNVRVFSHPIDIERSLINLIKSYFFGLPLSIFRNYSYTLKDEISSLARENDIIFVDHYLMFQYVPQDFTGRVILHQHNAEFVMWSRFAGTVGNPLKKLLLKLEAHRVKKYEVHICEKADVILAAPNDREALVGLGVSSEKFVETLHLGDEIGPKILPLKFEKTTNSLLYIGTLTWEANIDGLFWFLAKVWPLIKKKNPSVTLSIVGKMTAKLRSELSEMGAHIFVLGFVDDLESLYRSHRVFVAPLRFGSGIKVKVVNSLSRGMPTVTTPTGVEGLTKVNEEHVSIATEASDFAYSVIVLLENKPVWDKFSKNARAIMKEHYTWDKVLKNVDRSLTYDI